MEFLIPFQNGKKQKMSAQGNSESILHDGGWPPFRFFFLTTSARSILTCSTKKKREKVTHSAVKK